MSVDDFDTETGRRAWDAQERSLRDESLSVALAQALRNPPLPPIPVDFAAVTAMLAQRRHATDDRLERLLQTVAVLLMVMLAVAAIALAGGQLAGTLSLVVPSPSGSLVRWGAVIVACLVLSVGLDRWTTRFIGGASLR